jgi:hypothetical protein
MTLDEAIDLVDQTKAEAIRRRARVDIDNDCDSPLQSYAFGEKLSAWVVPSAQRAGPASTAV